MKLQKYNDLQIQRIKSFASLCHEDPEKIAPQWVKDYSEKFSEHVRSLGIVVEQS